MTSATQAHRGVGDLMRAWRTRRGISQLGLALKAEISARHLSFVETGRAQPSREMVLRLAEHLNMPLRERNAMLLAAGFAPAFSERSLDDPALSKIRRLVEQLLRAHEPYPALALDRRWNVLAMNNAVGSLLGGVAAELAGPPVNAMRIALHPGGLAPRIVNFAEWREHLLERLRHQIEATADVGLADLYKEVSEYPVAPGGDRRIGSGDSRVIVPLQLMTPMGALNLISTTMVFGTPLDVTLSELAIETFLPADDATSSLLHAVVRGTAPEVALERG